MISRLTKNILQVIVVIAFLITLILLSKVNQTKILNAEQMNMAKAIESESEYAEIENEDEDEQLIELQSLDEEETTEKYTIYVLARIVSKDSSDADEQKYKCIINKNVKGAVSGLVDVTLTSATSPDSLSITTNDDAEELEDIVEDYEAEVKVNNYGDWLYNENYYTITVDSINISDNTYKATALEVGKASDADIDDWKQGRSLNSTFDSDMEIIEKSSADDICDRVCDEMQYTWTFEQIETFKAYIEVMNDAEKEEWTNALNNSDTKLGY